MSMLMKAQRDKNNSTSLCSFHEKVNAGHGRRYDLLCECYEVDGFTGCTTSRKVSDVKNTLHSAARLIFYSDGHIGKMMRQCGFYLPQ